MGNLVAKYAFFPPSPPTYDQSLEGLFFISHKNEAIPAVLHTIPDSEEQPADPFVILFTHGNAEDIGPETQSWLKYFSIALNAHIISYDYVGYGLNQPGEPNGKNCYRNIEAVWNYLIDIRKYSPKKIILLGRSIGSGPTVHLASKLFERSRKAKKKLQKLERSSRKLAKKIHKIEKLNHDIERLPGAVILQSPIASCIRVVSNALATALPFDLFANIKKIHKIECPITIVHGTNDQVVPFAHAQMLWKQYQLKDVGQFVALHAADHNNIEVTSGYRDDYIMAVRKLLRDLDECYGRHQMSLSELEEPNEPLQMNVVIEEQKMLLSAARASYRDTKIDKESAVSLKATDAIEPSPTPTSVRTERHESNSSIRYCTLSSQDASSESHSNSSSPRRMDSKDSSLRSPSMIISVDEKLLRSAELHLPDPKADFEHNHIRADTSLHNSLDQLSFRFAQKPFQEVPKIVSEDSKQKEQEEELETPKLFKVPTPEPTRLSPREATKEEECSESDDSESDESYDEEGEDDEEEDRTPSCEDPPKILPFVERIR
eukprot:TRINITY_DN4085_c0_g1_i3.p1 TRINITY_DN4085_c0_g1~~TRINITY_DN4085_c0_g1_i3.p1  ORF type:complete len:546 (+),score=130.98 TRINITY_DN4085_c0_g1_i3:223-1860(+)